MMDLLSKKISQAEESVPSSYGEMKEFSHCLDICTLSNFRGNDDKGCKFHSCYKHLYIYSCTVISWDFMISQSVSHPHLRGQD